MNAAHQWWLTNTPAGRRLLDRVVPASALPRVTRELICDEQGHDPLGDGTCRRCGHELPEKGRR